MQPLKGNKMELKQCVRLFGISNEMLVGHLIVCEAFREMGYEVIITSVRDSEHSTKSKHYTGNAIDYRLRHLEAVNTIDKLYKMIKSRLNSEFDVVVEDIGTEYPHLHVEYDPDFRDVKTTITKYGEN